MREPIKEWLMVCDLKDIAEKGNINCTSDAEGFILELYDLLDEYVPFLDQRSSDQLNWLKKLHEKYAGNSKW